MPTFTKVSHTSFSVSDADRSARFWQETFGFQVLEAVSGESWHGTVMVHPTTATVLEVQQHDTNGGERFDPARTGFDHLGLLVDDPVELDAWEAHFDGLGVAHSPVVHREYGSVLAFKDPDGIQFEMFFRAGHP